MGAKELIELESDAAEASGDLAEPDGVTGCRVKGGTVLSVRLNEEEFAALTELAHAKHIRPRRWRARSSCRPCAVTLRSARPCTTPS